jgi:hypothetical protein
MRIVRVMRPRALLYWTNPIQNPLILNLNCCTLSGLKNRFLHGCFPCQSPFHLLASKFFRSGS